MELIRGIYNIKSFHRGCMLGIGNFDGFHRGHQMLISLLRLEKYKRKLPIMIMLFEPQPQEYFAKIVFRLTCLRNKLKYLDAAGVDTVLCVHFNDKFATMKAYDFINSLLVQRLGVKFICVGDDFRFGMNRDGNFNFLKDIAEKFDVKVKNVPTCREGTCRISSTSVREALLNDDLSYAELLLGHPYCISGRVGYGKSLGKSIGFPTANLVLKKICIPVCGVYVVTVFSRRYGLLPGVANIGISPTVPKIHQTLEVHLFDVMINLYGLYIDVVIKYKLRNEKRFLSLFELRNQIKKDIIDAKNYFNLNKQLFKYISKLNIE